MSLVWLTSSLFGFRSQLRLPYVTSFILSIGTSSFLMNQIMFVGFTPRPSFSLWLISQIHLMLIWTVLFCVLDVAWVVGSSDKCLSLCHISFVPIQWFMWLVWGKIGLVGCVPLILMWWTFWCVLYCFCSWGLILLSSLLELVHLALFCRW